MIKIFDYNKIKNNKNRQIRINLILQINQLINKMNKKLIIQFNNLKLMNNKCNNNNNKQMIDN